MTTYPWRAALTRWGDALFRLALLHSDDRTAAERATIQAFTRSFALASEDLETALYAALLRDRPRRRYPFRRRRLPRSLDRIAPADRVLLGVWLLRGIDGPRLLVVAGQPAEMVVSRLASAILPALDAHDPTPLDRGIFEQWLRRQLGFAPGSAIDSAAYAVAQADDWQDAINELRHTLREAVGRLHLPPNCVELIEMELLEPQTDAEPRWWRQRAAVIGTVLIVLALIWIVKPWQSGLSGVTGASRTSKELVQATLDAWTTTPVTGTLHRRVLAFEPRFKQRPLTTDVWLSADSAQHRVEVRNGQALIEWQVGDGSSRLSYAAFPLSSSCGWAVEASVLDQSARRFTVSVQQQRAARDAALLRGAYGQGYHALRAALSASDLRSFGTRIEGKTTLLVLGYTDRQTTPERKLLLWIDPAHYTLHAVREVAAAGGQADARDLWRLQSSEELSAGMSMVPPSWPGRTLTRDRLLDPGCPGLDADRIVSLRSFVGNRWWGYQQWYLPGQLPDDISFGAMVSPTASSGMIDNNQISAIFVGPSRWLSLRLVSRNASPSEGIERGGWRVTFYQETETLRGSACRRFTDARNGFCVPSVSFTAHGWSREELLSLIETLTVLDGQSWAQYNKLFLDPQPLDSQSHALVEQSIAAIQQLKQESLYSIAERYARVAEGRPTLADPYHVPLDLMQPERSSQEQWIEYAGGRMTRFRELHRHSGNDLISARLADGTIYSEYYLPGGAVWRRSVQDQPEMASSIFWTGEDLLLSLLAQPEGLSARQDGERWLLEQTVHMEERNNNRHDPRYLEFGGVISWVGDLQTRTFTHRLWIDPASALPLEAATVHRDEQGRETEIIRILLQIRPHSESFNRSVFTMPPLPEDTISFEVDHASEPRVAATSFPVDLPARTLYWDSDGIQRMRERSSFDPAVFATEHRATTLSRAISASLSEIERMGLIQSADYRFPDQSLYITLRQGPRLLLRYTLRYQSGLADGRDRVWTSSQRFPTTIAGRSRDVWLLETSSQYMLVFEIEDLLVQIEASDADTLVRSVLPALPKLEWTAGMRSP